LADVLLSSSTHAGSTDESAITSTSHLIPHLTLQQQLFLARKSIWLSLHSVHSLAFILI